MGRERSRNTQNDNWAFVLLNVWYVNTGRGHIALSGILTNGRASRIFFDKALSTALYEVALSCF